MLTIDQLKQRRALYVQALQEVQQQAAQAARQVTIQEGAIAAIDDLLKMVEAEDAPLAEMDITEMEGAEFVAAR
jgi:hypothetical protein